MVKKITNGKGVTTSLDEELEMTIDFDADYHGRFFIEANGKIYKIEMTIQEWHKEVDNRYICDYK